MVMELLQLATAVARLRSDLAAIAIDSFTFSSVFSNGEFAYRAKAKHELVATLAPARAGVVDSLFFRCDTDAP